ncbi:hypothetical protein M4D79_21055 [Mycolicibacterium novocastrense]|nr:hypothetical protein M4D79_21055 [Mycolicibacterium novocastrense]
MHTHALAPPITFLPYDIERLFVRAFTEGARDPEARPTATEWRNALSGIQIGTCARGHQIPVEADPCPWCVIEDQRAVRRARASHPPVGSLPDQVIYPAFTPDPPAPTPVMPAYAASAPSQAPHPKAPPPPAAGGRRNYRPVVLGVLGRGCRGTRRDTVDLCNIWRFVVEQRSGISGRPADDRCRDDDGDHNRHADDDGGRQTAGQREAVRQPGAG